MINAIAYTNVPELNLLLARKQIAFPVTRETQLSAVSKLTSGFNRVLIPDPNNPAALTPIGEVPVSRPYLDYAEMMDWLVKEFQEIGIPFKLRASVINKKNFGLYQEYIFDMPVVPPDGEGISPMVLVKASYTKGPPLSLYLGTYRYVCANGAIVSVGKNTSISVNSRNWSELSNRGFHDNFKTAFDHYADVSVFYAKLGAIPLSKTIYDIFLPNVIPFCIRKKVIGQLEETGNVMVNVSTDKPEGEKFKALKEEDFLCGDFIQVISDVSTWNVYNRFTDIASKLSTSDRVLVAGKSIDKVFRSLKAAA